MLHGSISYQWSGFLLPSLQFACHSTVPSLFFLNQQLELQQHHLKSGQGIPPYRPLYWQCPSSYNGQYCGSCSFQQIHNLPVSSSLSSCLHRTSTHECRFRLFVLYIFHSASDRRERRSLANQHSLHPLPLKELFYHTRSATQRHQSDYRECFLPHPYLPGFGTTWLSASIMFHLNSLSEILQEIHLLPAHHVLQIPHVYRNVHYRESIRCRYCKCRSQAGHQTGQEAFPGSSSSFDR